MQKDSTAKQETRLSIRANPSQKRLLVKAAQARHMNVSQFVLGVSLREAEHIVDSETRIYLSEEEYDWLVKLMDETPLETKPRLLEAFQQKPVWEA